MPIKLPDFKNTHCIWVAACGEIPSADKELVKWMKDEEDQVSSFRTSGGLCYIRLMLGGGSGKHVHLDIMSPAFASKKVQAKAKVKTKATLEHIQESMDRLLGKEVELNLRGGFTVKPEELPEGGMVRSLIFQTKMGNVAIKLSGAMFSIEGAPVQTISWYEGSGGNINITLDAEVKTIISENYLVTGFDTLAQAFNVFVLGKV